MAQEVISFYTGKPGAGKSYYAVYTIGELLKLKKVKGVITNLPLTEKFPFIMDCELIDPKEFLKMAGSGDISMLKDKDINGKLIVIDEFHLMCPRTGMNAQRKIWKEFLAEIRHHGAMFWGISQSTDQIDREVMRLAPCRYEVINKGNLTSYIFGIPYSEIYELIWAVTGVPHHVFRAKKYSYTVKWILESSRDIQVRDEVFGWYMSRSAAFGSDKGALEYEKPGILQSIRGFWQWRYHLGFRLAAAIFFCWLFLGGGFLWGIQAFTEGLQNYVVGQRPTQQNVGIPEKENKTAEGPKIDVGKSVSNDVTKQSIKRDKPKLLSKVALNQGYILLADDVEYPCHEMIDVTLAIKAYRMPYHIIGRAIIERRDNLHEKQRIEKGFRLGAIKMERN